MSNSNTIDQIRRSHLSAKPNAAQNPAWANCHMDCGVLLAEVARLQEALRKVCDSSGIGSVAYQIAAGAFRIEPRDSQCNVGGGF